MSTYRPVDVEPILSCRTKQSKALFLLARPLVSYYLFYKTDTTTRAHKIWSQTRPIELSPKVDAVVLTQQLSLSPAHPSRTLTPWDPVRTCGTMPDISSQSTEIAYFRRERFALDSKTYHFNLLYLFLLE